MKFEHRTEDEIGATKFGLGPNTGPKKTKHSGTISRYVIGISMVLLLTAFLKYYSYRILQFST